jgi:hypothetical protein
MAKTPQLIEPIKNATMDDVARKLIKTTPLFRQLINRRATHYGNGMDKIGIDINCYVLNDVEHSVVLTAKNMSEVLGLGSGGSRSLISLLRSKHMQPFVGENLLNIIDNALIFDGSIAGKNSINKALDGYDISVISEGCDAIMDAYVAGDKFISQELYTSARILDKAAKKTGWKTLGWAIAGYNPQAQEIIDSFRTFLIKEMEMARKWVKTFPDELYLEWASIYGVPVMVGKNRHVMHRWLTIRHIYEPFARSNGKIIEMLREKRANDPSGKHKKLHQYLSEDLGLPELRKHLYQVLTIAQLSNGKKDKYEHDFNKLFGKQLQFNWDLLNEDEAT